MVFFRNNNTLPLYCQNKGKDNNKTKFIIKIQ
ncbi:hypothetical protein EZS27_004117 [termite gut metagenome]|uniref:Uncharacterized protein n=1 Tax=termite gut metagenome TaxID=433724 RepID=A0A5J4STG0_9ZZZZ